MSKYAEDIATIKERTKHILRQLKKMNASQAKQWDQINENSSAIEVLKSLGEIKVAKISGKAYVLAAVVMGVSAVIGGLVSSWF